MRSVICLALLLAGCQPTPADYAVERVFDQLTGQPVIRPPTEDKSFQTTGGDREPTRSIPPPTNDSSSQIMASPEPEQLPDEQSSSTAIPATGKPLPDVTSQPVVRPRARPIMPKEGSQQPVAKVDRAILGNQPPSIPAQPAGKDLLSRHIPCNQLPSSAECSNGGAQ
jgi:hypothetical protein